MDIDDIDKDAYWSIAKISQRFLEYYREHGYDIIPGSSLLDPSVPMSFVMSAGLVQVERSAAQLGGRRKTRYALLQNCFRYFDLDTVGNSDYHLTLFQMAGAFTFGPIERKASFTKVWELLTQVYGLDPAALWVTYFHGGDVAGYEFDPDHETREAWISVGVPESRIVGLGSDDNFWKQSTGVVSELEAPKCGPNTEVFFDRGEHLKCSPNCKPGCRCGRFVEIQNLLLISWHLDEGARVLRPLEEPFVEVVMGVERMAMLLQEKKTVFDIGLFLPLINFVQKYSPNFVDEKHMVDVHILVDHLRALLFLTVDGAPRPGRGGRARLMRQLSRGVLTSEKVLRITDKSFIENFLLKMGIVFHRQQPLLLVEVREKLLESVKEERQIFENTLMRGERKLDRILDEERETISGKEMVTPEKQDGLYHRVLLSLLEDRLASFDEKDYQQAYQTWYQQVAN